MLRSRTVIALSLAGIGILGFTACVAPPAPVEVEQPDVEETEESAPVTAEGQPAWALPATTEGDKIATIEVGGVVVEVYQVGVTKATKTGQFANPETGDPIIAVGDEIVFVNYVVSNTGDPIDLGYSLVSISTRYDDWPYLQGMDSVVDSALFAELGVNDDPFGPDSYVDPGVFVFGTGERYSFAQNFPYQSGSPFTVTVTLTPVDEEGDLIHDDRLEVEGAGTIK